MWGSEVAHRLWAGSSLAGSGFPLRSQTASTPRPSAAPEPRHRGEGTGTPSPSRGKSNTWSSSRSYRKLLTTICHTVASMPCQWKYCRPLMTWDAWRVRLGMISRNFKITYQIRCYIPSVSYWENCGEKLNWAKIWPLPQNFLILIKLKKKKVSFIQPNTSFGNIKLM